MSQGSPTPDFIQQSTETVARFIQWIATLIRRRNWFMLLVLLGVALALLGSFFREQINTRFLTDSAQGPVWASFWTGVALLFVGALAVAVVTMPRSVMSAETVVDEGKAIRGLRPFGKKDAEIFARLQREVSLRECCEAVTNSSYKFGILMGESGCGKTSFLQAGVWPKLTEINSSHCAIYVRFSDQDPMATVRKALAEQLEMPMEWVKDSSFSKLLNQATEAAGKPIVLLFDQFEQFFVHNPRKAARAPFIQALNTWYKDPSLEDVKVLVSICADLLHELYALHEALQYSLGPQDLFKLERFTPEEATKILAVIAENEQLDFDHRFVTEIAEQELAHRESGTISPVDLQVLAWMIVRQKGDELRAFNRTAFQKFGGVEGLLTRFLEYTLEPRILPNQRQAAIKTLQALTDLDRQVRAGVLSVAEIQAKLKGTVPPDEIAETVTWLSRSDVRLITPQDKDRTVGYELAHERLIPALMRLAGKELTTADKANQLLERRVNEWLGNQKASRYLLSWRELWLIRQQRPYLIWGAKRKQKEKLIGLSQREAYKILGLSGVAALIIGTFYGWLNFTTPGQMRQVRWALSNQIERISDESTANVANALIKDKQYAKGIGLIQKHIDSQRTKASALTGVAQTAVEISDPNLIRTALESAEAINEPKSKSSALIDIAGAYGQLAQPEQTIKLLEEALVTAKTINDAFSKSSALSAIAEAAGQLEQSEQAVKLLEKALATAEAINEPNFKSSALIDIAGAYGQLAQPEQAIKLLQKALATAEAIDEPSSKSSVLIVIAEAAGQLEQPEQAVKLLEKALATAEAINEPDFKSSALIDIAGAYGQLAQPEQAIKLLEKALATAEARDELSSKFQVLIAIAEAPSQLAQPEQAIKLLEKALTTVKTIDEPRVTSQILSAIAEAAGQLAQPEQAIKLLEKALATAEAIDEPDFKSYALSAIAEAYVQLAQPEQAIKLLEKALAMAEAINDPNSKFYALSAIAEAYVQLAQPEQAVKLLEKALATVEAIDDPNFKSQVLSTTAKTAGQMGNIDIAQDLLIQIREVAEKANASDVLGQIASSQALYGDLSAALRTLRTCLEEDKVNALAQILTFHAESQTPSLIDGPAVLAVEVASKVSGSYEVSVTIQSPDEGCDRHTNWWEVLSEEGTLLGRKIIDTPHDFERPFTTQETIDIPDPNQAIIVRAHFSDDINQDSGRFSDSGIEKYPTQAMKGKLSEPDSFKSIRLPARFAAQVEKQGNQPKECKKK